MHSFVLSDMQLMWLDHKLSNELTVVVKAGKPTSTWLRHLPGKKRTYRTIYRGVHSVVDQWTHNKLSLDEDDEKIKI